MPESLITLAMDMAQIYQQKALDTLSEEDLAHARRYRQLGTWLAELNAENAALRAQLENVVTDGRKQSAPVNRT